MKGRLKVKEYPDTIRDIENLSSAILNKNKSRESIACFRLISDASRIIRDNPKKSAAVYMEARNRYMKLPYFEKKEIYSELFSLYQRLEEKNG